MDRIVIAKIKKPQGVKGELRLATFLDDNSNIMKIKNVYIEGNEQPYEVERCFKVSSDYAVKLKNIDSFEQANQFKSKNVLCLRSDLSQIVKDGIFIADLIDKKAYFEDGQEVGVISDVENYGASDVVFIESSKYKNLSFANIGGIILSCDENRVVLNKEKFYEVCVYDEE